MIEITASASLHFGRKCLISSLNVIHTCTLRMAYNYNTHPFGFVNDKTTSIIYYHYAEHGLALKMAGFPLDFFMVYTLRTLNKILYLYLSNLSIVSIVFSNFLLLSLKVFQKIGDFE